MIFNTWTFALFAICALSAYWLAVPQRLKPFYLIAVGVVFYAWSVPAYLALIGILGAITYGALRVITNDALSRSARRTVFVCAVTIVVAVLLFFKYAKFLALTVDQVARTHVVPVPSVIVPLAISFFTFEFVHVLADGYGGKIKHVDPLDFAVFTMFFPTLVAGPIKRYQSFAPQVRAIEPLPADLAFLNLYRIAIGLFKKIVLADSASIFTQPILTPGAPYGALDYWMATLAYAAKIYFDFTGYSDIAIGVAGLLGFAIPENFDRPYWAPNIAAFWRRWHMSLSSWIRDYIFIPLGGSRRPPAIVMLNLLVAMGLAGLWHGAAWTFVLWGLWHGAGLAAHRVWSLRVVPRIPVLRRGGTAVNALSIVTTFTFVALGWVTFAATSLPNAALVYRAMLALAH